jgi:hypothetical protein
MGLLHVRGSFMSFPEIEVERLKKRIAELEIALAKANSVLEDNDLSEEPAKVSDEEVICVSEIHKLRVASDNGILTLEDVKILDLLVKNLLAIRGKSVPEEKPKKKGTKSVAELLSIVKEKK